MLSFECDYNKGAHPKILEALAQNNMVTRPGYGCDDLCDGAREKIKKCIGCEDADVWFLVGGTQTNQTIISSMLASYEGVIAAETGHVNTHEAGAIEYTGHKVLPLPQYEGKIKAKDLRKYLEESAQDGNKDHMVFPGMTYISHPTEYGTLYTLAELKEISEICHEFEIPLFLDGARLGYGLACKDTDVTIQDVAQLCDVFYIGGTKVGALFGEAVVFPKGNAPKHFMTIMKQHGALLAKGWLLGLQFDTLFTDNLYFTISRHANDMADKLREIFRKKGYQFFIETKTNQIFVILSNKKQKELEQLVSFSFWEKIDADCAAVRFATSWGTTDAELEALEKLL